MRPVLTIKQTKAYTVYSSDDERSGSEKGIYKDFGFASKRAIGSGWYGSNGEVLEKKNIYEDETGELYIVKHVGKFNDVEEKIKEDTLASIKSKLSKEELDFLKIK